MPRGHRALILLEASLFLLVNGGQLDAQNIAFMVPTEPHWQYVATEEFDKQSQEFVLARYEGSAAWLAAQQDKKARLRELGTQPPRAA